MIDDRIYKEVLESGLSLDHYFVLCNIKNGKKLVESKRVKGFVNLLNKKEYLKDGNLTEKGIDLVQNCELSKVIVVATEAVQKEEVEFGEWIKEVYLECQNRLVKLTGQKQIRAKIDRKSYSFLPNMTDFSKVLLKAISLYKLDDYARIKRTLLRYIDKCANENEWFPLMQYYIMKSGMSAMVTEMQNEDDDSNSDIDFKSSQKFI